MSLAANDVLPPHIGAIPCSQCGPTVRGVPQQTNRGHSAEIDGELPEDSSRRGRPTPYSGDP